MIWLAVWAFGTGFFFQYLVWGLPFLLLARHLRAAALLQVVTAVAGILFYAGPWSDRGLVVVFVVLMLAAWIGWLGGLALATRAPGPRTSASAA